jgi:hypothetical protein
MAVVQISKIQVRRGKKNSTTGVPQLSSGELAWAVDSQELYIGNGSVAEGSPAVGNSKVLTEHDNLLELLGGYQFAQDPIHSFPYSVRRSMQSKLDETVSVKDFGAVGNGIIDDTAAFQAALERLFLSPEPKYFKKLIVPKGNYLISGNLYIPTNTVLVGESSLSVLVLGTSITPANIYFENINGDRDGDATWQSGTMPVNVLISNLSINTSNGTVDISGLNHSTFDNVTFTGGYAALGDAIIKNAVYFNNTDFGTQTNRINFDTCKFTHVDVGVRMLQGDSLETIVKFSNCEFSVVGRGVWTTGVAGQRNLWSYNNCTFNEVATEAVWTTGSGAKVNACTFIRCGNGANGDILPATSIVRFVQNADNVVSNCSFTRTQALMDVLTASTPCVPEVRNGAVSIANRLIKAIANPLGFLTVFSADVTKIKIDYTLVLTAGTRVGTLSIDVSKANQTTVISDDYTYTGTNTSLMEGFTFSTTFGDYDTPPDSVFDTLMLRYTSGATGTINFVVGYSV